MNYTKSALTCIVPDTAGQIQTIREKHDTAFGRWMPHFNINCFPFYNPDRCTALIPLIESVCKKYYNMVIRIDGVGFFPCKKNKAGTLYGIVRDTTGNLLKLRNELLDSFGKNISNDFVPHLTLGRFNTQQELDDVMNTINWTPIEFELCGLDLIVRDDGPFSVIHNFSFNKNPVYLCNKYTIGNNYIYKIRPASTDAVEQTNICNFILIDNSGSMGNSTKMATQIIAKGMYGMQNVNLIPGEILLFSTDVKIFEDIKTSSDVDKIIFPQQSQTNITNAIKVAIDRIVAHNKNRPENIHYVLTFLSDGYHNCGPELNGKILTDLKQKITQAEIKLSVIVVGLLSNDTKLGMQIKTQLENTNINALKSVYYASKYEEMKIVLDQLIEGCSMSLNGALIKKCNVVDGKFVENMSTEINLFLSNGDNIIFVASDGNPKLYIDGQLVVSNDTEFNDEDIKYAINSLLPKMSQMKIAYGSLVIKDQIAILENFINLSEDFFKRVSTVSKLGTSARDRLNILKQIKKSQYSFQEERNKLKSLNAAMNNNSSQQAEYLDGFNKKYSLKAVIRSGIIDVTISDVLSQMESIIGDLEQALEKDKIIESETQQSFLSLNTPIEQISEWIDFDVTQFTDIYSLLVYFGLSCYPVKFQSNNAVQMDPFQTECEYIETSMIDSANLMLSNQLGHKLISPVGKHFVDGLIIMDPTNINTFQIIKKTYIYQYLCSVTLCKDLYMYNPSMTFAMHAHALVKCVDNFYELNSKAYIELALKIVYSFKNLSKKNDTLFNHWWTNWETITQSQEDNCNHPVQLIMLLACKNVTENGYVPLLNLINEVLARQTKIRYALKSDSDEYVIKYLQQLLGINKYNSPLPLEDVLQTEPSDLSVRENCQIWSDAPNMHLFNGEHNCQSIEYYINRATLKYARTFQFAYILSQHTDVDTISNLMDVNCVFDYLSRFDDNFVKNRDNAVLAMYLQAMMHHSSKTRVKINTRSVTDGCTLADMIVNLRMAIYYDSCKVKREKWLEIIGDVSYAEALESDDNVFSQLIGVHTHGLSKKQFWAYLRAACDSNCEDKINSFKGKTNHTFDKCLRKIKKN